MIVWSQVDRQKGIIDPFTSICIEDKSTGFNWENRGWVAVKFVADEKFIVQKIPPAEYKPANGMWHMSCESRQDFNPGNGGKKVTFGCYNVRKFGRELMPFSSDMCMEIWDGSTLEEINCSKTDPPFFFLPDGAFIRYPRRASIDLSTNPKDNYKDSLSLAVGKCGVTSK